VWSAPRGRFGVPAMRRLTTVAATVAFLGAGIAPATAARTGVVEGRVVNQSTGQPQSGVRLTLTSGTEDGAPRVIATTRSDARGRYRFDDLITGEDRFYALDARFDGGLYAGRPLSLPSDTNSRPVIQTTMRVWNSTSDPEVMVINRDALFVVGGDDGLGVIQSVTVTNTSDDAYIGRGAGLLGDAASGASVAFGLPEGASDIQIRDSDLDIPAVVPVDGGFAATVAFPPGETSTTFSYALSSDDGSFDLSRPVLYPTLELSIYAADPLEIRSNRLQEADEIDLEGRTYRQWASEQTIEAGDPLQAIAVTAGTVPVWPVVAGIAVLVALGTIAGSLLRRRKPSAPPVDRDKLLEEVAHLDLEFEGGRLERDDWDDRRTELMGRLRALEKSRS
jgi:hypothetical protein